MGFTEWLPRQLEAVTLFPSVSIQKDLRYKWVLPQGAFPFDLPAPTDPADSLGFVTVSVLVDPKMHFVFQHPGDLKVPMSFPAAAGSLSFLPSLFENDEH